MEKQSIFGYGCFRRSLVIILTTALVLCSLVACGRPKDGTVENADSSYNEGAEAYEIDQADLPEGTTFAGAALP